MFDRSNGPTRLRHRKGRLATGVLTMLVAALAATVAATSSAGSTQDSSFTATALTPSEIIEASKSLTGGLAESDPSLLGRTDATPVNVMVKLDYDSIATYEAASRACLRRAPRVTGEELRTTRRAVDAYESYVARVEAEIRRRSSRRCRGAGATVVPEVYGGARCGSPRTEIGDLLGVDGVVAVQKDSLAQPLTDATPAFLGATSVWP